jgi:xylose isomerase
MKLNVSAHVFCLGTYAERYVPGGYFEEMNIDQMLEIFSKTEGLDGIFQMYPPALMPKDPVKLLKKVADFGLKIGDVFVEQWSDRKWKNGPYSCTDKKVRGEAIKEFKEGLDFATELKAESVLLWPAHDGFDYPFQANYYDGLKYFVETLQEIGEHAPDMKIAVEAKNKDPRQRQYASDTGKVMMHLQDVGLDNVGGALDVGHSFMAQENIAESLVILDTHKKLFQIHLNENYRDADPDMLFGTVNFWEILEFYYYLNKTDYEGWQAIDIIAPRDDRAKSLQLGVSMVHKFKELADRLTEHAAEIDGNVEGYRFADNMELIRELVLK